MKRAAGELKVGVSACLFGEKVRYDGQHKRDGFVCDALAHFVTLVPVCPELEVGMGVPRETIRLEARGRAVKLVAPKSGTDWTDRMDAWSEKKCDTLEGLDLSGYILKKDSPSCGLERVKVWDPNGVPAKTGQGFFARALTARFPLLPVEEEGRLHDARLRESFVERVFAYRRVTDFFRGRWTTGGLVSFHTAEKLFLLAHEPEAYKSLGRLVARARSSDREKLAATYRESYMRALAKGATRGRHGNVLQHMAGYFRDLCSEDERKELAEMIADYRKGLVPLVVPITLIRHHVRKHKVEYLDGQVYLEPHPKELMLRNHV
jgi:uncharacterized protein YbgA (DUF1722 family)/uncharacterized protein YbbK (DUF523 family)